MSDFPQIIETLSGHYKYWEYSIGYTDIHLSGLPESVSVQGSQLIRKDEFHITTVNVKKIAELVDSLNAPDIMVEIVQDFKDFLKDNKLDKFQLSDQFRFVQRGDEKTVIVMCELVGMSQFFARLRRKYDKPLPTQPFHITLYTLNSQYGIGILSDEELNKITVPIELPELKNIKPA